MKAIINALTLALLDADQFGSDIAGARAFATLFVEENVELLSGPPTVTQVRLRPDGRPDLRVVPADLREQGQPLDEDTSQRAVVHRVPVVGADGLTDVQRAAIGTVGLCRNCQQPKNRHLPGCAVASGENPRAETKDPLPPVQ